MEPTANGRRLSAGGRHSLEKLLVFACIAQLWVPHPSRFLRRVGGRRIAPLGFAVHAARAANEIFAQPSLTRTNPGSSRR
jgi:hypothetical protein